MTQDGCAKRQLRSLRAGRPVDGSTLLEPLDMLLPEPLEVDGSLIDPLPVDPVVPLLDGLLVEPLVEPLVDESEDEPLVDGLVVEGLAVEPVEPEVLESVLLGLVVLPEVVSLVDPLVLGGVDPVLGVVMPLDDEPLGDVLLDELEPVGPLPVVLLLLPVLSAGLDAPVEPVVGEVVVWA